ncbi:MAG: class II aldolase/adducin family protein [Eubacteriales bacterium]|nr:class II aldolase/adducin family protein [Eubacteriales bacterium]
MIMQKERELIVEYGKKLSASGLCPGTSGNLSICDRETGLMAISPSGMDYFEVTPEDIVVLDINAYLSANDTQTDSLVSSDSDQTSDTKSDRTDLYAVQSKPFQIADGTRKPSSEWALHSKFYKVRPEIASVIHTHSVYATTFSVLNQPLKPVHFAFGRVGAMEVPCAPYALFGTMELADIAARTAAEAGSNAVLLANHGIICCGADPCFTADIGGKVGAGSKLSSNSAIAIKAAYELACDLEYCAELQYRAMSIGSPVYLSESQMTDVLNQFKGYGQPT